MDSLLPWRIPYSATMDEPSHEADEWVVHITTVVEWANVIDPGDPIEIICSCTGNVIFSGFVTKVKKTTLLDMSKSVIEMWKAGADRDSLHEYLRRVYDESVTLTTPIAVILLDKESSMERVGDGW